MPDRYEEIATKLLKEVYGIEPPEAKPEKKPPPPPPLAHVRLTDDEILPLIIPAKELFH